MKERMWKGGIPGVSRSRSTMDSHSRYTTFAELI